MNNREQTIESALQLLQIADATGVLKMVGYLLNDLDDLAETGVSLLEKPETAGMIATGAKWLDVIKALDPEAISRVANTFTKVAEEWEMDTPALQVHSAWDLVKVLRDPDVSLVLSKLFSAMKTVGASMKVGNR
jgi:uncharacterized protein YjgD (DUF1641 family)